MRSVILRFLIAVPVTAYSQGLDTRAELKIEGGISEISVSPEGKLWMVSAVGKIYSADNISSTWHYRESLSDDQETFQPQLERISFFNNQTAIMSGYIPVKKEGFVHNGIYRTTDGGSTWKVVDFGGDSWIYDAQSDRSGNAWMGGSSGEIFYSNDDGQKWTKLNSPFNDFSRMHSIHMSNSTVGTAGALHNLIYTTENNWKSFNRLPTPNDQKIYKIKEGSENDRIEKIRVWKGDLVAMQSGHVSFSDFKKPEWKLFPITVIDFEIDEVTGDLYAVTKDLQVIKVLEDFDTEILSRESLAYEPVSIKSLNGDVFILDRADNIYRINSKSTGKLLPLTNDHPIQTPAIVRQGKKLIWGVNANHIYLSTDQGEKWFREKTIEFGIGDCTLLSDSVAIIWDGFGSNYTYFLKTHSLSPFALNNPLESFLKSSVKQLLINAGSQGCFHSNNNSIDFIASSNDELVASNWTEVQRFKQKESSTDFRKTIRADQLKSALNAINNSPSKVPALQEFGITDNDKGDYLRRVKRRTKDKSDYLSRKNHIQERVLYEQLPSHLDTVTIKTISKILNQQEGIWSTTSNWFSVRMINQSGDTLDIHRRYFSTSLPWNLPWKIEYKGVHFNSYDVNFSRFIDSCLPSDFTDKDVFSNSLLLMKIADYYWEDQ